METKSRTSTSRGASAAVQLLEATFGQFFLLACAWDALLANLLTASALLSLPQDPSALSTTCGQKSHGDDESEHSISKAVDGDEDGDEDKNGDGGFGDTGEELSSEDREGAGDTPNRKSNNSKASPRGEGGEVGKEGEGEEDGNEDDDDGEDDGDDEDDGDEGNEDDDDNDDDDDDEGEVKDEEEIVDEDEPEDDEEDEEEALQPPKKRKK